MFRQDKHIRGRKRIPYLVARRIAAEQLQAGDVGIQWGGVTLPSKAKYKGFFVMGEQGSGKTLSFYLLLHEAFKKGDAQKTRAVVYDYKMNIAPFLTGKLGISEDRIKIMNPYDTRACGWDMQADIGDWDVALEVAYNFVPEQDNEGSGRFFTEAARLCFHGVIMYFVYRTREREKENATRKSEGKPELEPIRWTFRDVLEGLRRESRMRQMFERYPSLEESLDYLNRSNNEVLAAIRTYTTKFRSIAARWQGKELISLRKWYEEDDGKILILGYDADRAFPLSILNRLLLQRIPKTVQGSIKAERPDVWILLDEFHSLGYIPEFSQYAATLRDYRGTLGVATQGIKQIEKHFKEEADTIAEELSSRAFLRCSKSSADFASLFIQDAEKNVRGRGISFGAGQNITYSNNDSPQSQRVVTPSELSTLPMMYTRDDFGGFYLTSFLDDVYYHKITRRDLEHVWVEGGIKQDYRRETDPDAAELSPWSKEDFEKFNLDSDERGVQNGAETNKSEGREQEAEQQPGTFAMLMNKAAKPISKESVLSNEKTIESLAKRGIVINE